MKQATVAAIVKTRPSSNGSELRDHLGHLDWLELRADLAGDVPAAWIRQQAATQTMYALRSRAGGGLFDGSDEERRQRLIRAGEQFDFVELEADRDLTPALLEGISPEKRIISHHAPATDQGMLQRRFRCLAATPARHYRFSCPAENLEQAAVPLLFLKALGRTDVTAYATGLAGAWTSVLAPSFGWPIVFGTVANSPDLDDGLPVACLVDDYGFPGLGTFRELYGIVGNPVSHSLSPRIHNTAYRAAGRAAIFLPLPVEDFRRFWQSFLADDALAGLGLEVRGFTVASPLKETASKTFGDQSEIAQRAQSSNLVYRRNGTWRADTTDPDGVLLNLRRHSIPVAGSNVAVVGCGGSGRAIAAALKRAGSRVTMVNRNLERGRQATQLLRVPFVPLSEFRADAFSIVINATPVGRDGYRCAFEPHRLQGGSVVIDLVYGAQVTPLVEFGRKRGLTTIDGRDILCVQVARQFQRMTGQPLPTGLAERLSWLQPEHALPAQNHYSTATIQDPPCLSES